MPEGCEGVRAIREPEPPLSIGASTTKAIAEENEEVRKYFTSASGGKKVIPYNAGMTKKRN